VTQAMRIASALAALVCVAAAVLLVVLATDLRGYQRQLREDDLRFQTSPPSSDLWQIDSTLPRGSIERVLDVKDDLRYRDALLRFRRARPREQRYVEKRLGELRAEAALRLLELTYADQDPVRRGQASNYVGILSFVVGARETVRKRVEFYEAGIANFQTAVAADPSNEEAKFNLELALRRLDRETVVFDSPEGNSPRDDASKAGSLQSGSGY
jgi:hypothetical protein